jgi:predicted phage tail protein
MVVLHGYGALADMAPWPLDIEAPTVRSAIKLVAWQVPEFHRALVEGRFHVMRDGLCMDLETIDLPAGREVHIVPEAYGESGGNTGTYALIGLGVVLIGASLFIPGSTTLVAAGYSASAVSAAGFAATAAFSIGLSLTLAGVSQMLAPDPPEQDTGSDGSTLMGGQVNTASVDAVVPVAFGRVLVGSVVTSSGQSTVQLT